MRVSRMLAGASRIDLNRHRIEPHASWSWWVVSRGKPEAALSPVLGSESPVRNMQVQSVRQGHGEVGA